MNGKRVLRRSAKTGRAVTREEAAANPDTTVTETVEPRWNLDDLRVLFGALSAEVLEKVWEQFSENTDPIANKRLIEAAIREVYEGKR